MVKVVCYRPCEASDVNGLKPQEPSVMCCFPHLFDLCYNTHCKVFDKRFSLINTYFQINQLITLKITLFSYILVI